MKASWQQVRSVVQLWQPLCFVITDSHHAPGPVSFDGDIPSSLYGEKMQLSPLPESSGDLVGPQELLMLVRFAILLEKGSEDSPGCSEAGISDFVGWWLLDSSISVFICLESIGILSLVCFWSLIVRGTYRRRSGRGWAVVVTRRVQARTRENCEKVVVRWLVVRRLVATSLRLSHLWCGLFRFWRWGLGLLYQRLQKFIFQTKELPLDRKLPFKMINISWERAKSLARQFHRDSVYMWNVEMRGNFLMPGLFQEVFAGFGFEPKFSR